MQQLKSAFHNAVATQYPPCRTNLDIGRHEELQRRGDQRTDVVKRARAGRAEERFHFGEREFDWIEVGAVGSEKAELGAPRLRWRRGPPVVLWTARLSRTTTSPGWSVGAKTSRRRRGTWDCRSCGRTRPGPRPGRAGARRRRCASATGKKASDRGGGCPRDCARSGAADPSSRRIHQGTLLAHVASGSSPPLPTRPGTSGRACCRVFSFF